MISLSEEHLYNVKYLLQFIILLTVFGCGEPDSNEFCACMHREAPQLVQKVDFLFENWYDEAKVEERTLTGILHAFKRQGKFISPSVGQLTTGDKEELANSVSHCLSSHPLEGYDFEAIQAKWQIEVGKIEQSGKVDVVTAADAILNTYPHEFLNGCYYRYTFGGMLHLFMARDKGLKLTLPQELPPCEDCPEIKDRNVLKIVVTTDDVLEIEDELTPVDQVSERVEDFYLSDDDNMPERHLVNELTIADTLEKIKSKLIHSQSTGDSTEYDKWEKILKEWKGKEEAYNLLGEFKCIDKRAIIRYSSSNGTSFETYFNVIDQIKVTLRQLRNQCAEDNFGMTYDEMIKLEDERGDTSLRPKIRAVRCLYPLRLLEPDP